MIQQPKTWSQSLSWLARVRAHQAWRLLSWALSPESFPRARVEGATAYPHRHWRKSIALRRADEDAHPLLEAGKVRNLRLAAIAFDGLALEPGCPLSFWRTLGRISAEAGYAHGMELRSGCLVPALGGGICLLSNALFDLAARLGWRVLERHGHTLEAVPAWNRPWGMDATVFWPYVDLRVEPNVPSRLSVVVSETHLHIEVWGALPFDGRVELESRHDIWNDDVRCNEVWRRRWSAGGEWLGEEKIAENRKRIVDPGPRRQRNCLTCEEGSCRARVRL